MPPAITSAHVRVRNLANLALTSDHGAEVQFTVTKYGSLDICAAMARSLQTSFCSMRAKERKKVGEHVQGAFDKLICERTPLADGQGWVIALYRGNSISDEWEIIDRATGKPFGHVELTEHGRLIEEFVSNPQKFWDDSGKMARMRELEPEFETFAREYFTPMGG